ncbi:DnaJ sub C member 7 [Podochytrium sp. JEL0797]|nr:DnaJ sub C member 7 [Podochytrium sp. JEL0797]
MVTRLVGELLSLPQTLQGKKSNKKTAVEAPVEEEEAKYVHVDEVEVEETESVEEYFDDEEVQSKPQVRYTGFAPTKGWKPDRVSASMDPQQFFAKYVITRTPAIVTGMKDLLGKDSVFNKFAGAKDKPWVGIDALLEKVGGRETVEIESRKEGGNFGSGRERRVVLLEDFVEAMKSGDTSLYMSTQYSGDQDEDLDEDEGEDEEHVHGENCDHDHDHDDLEEDDEDDAMDEDDDDEDDDEEDNDEEEDGEGHEHGDDCDHEEMDPLEDNEENLLESFNDFCKAPLPRLIGELPLHPKLLPTLVPQQLNLWMGCAPPAGVSSGLHHDFAENLYLLLQGTKQFTLIPPSAATKLDLYGDADLQVVHENGLISYDWAVGSDGSFAADVARWKFKVAVKALKDGMFESQADDEVDLETLRKDVVEAKLEMDLAEEEEAEVAMYADEDDDEDDDDDEEPLFADPPADDEDADMEIDMDNLRDDYEEDGDDEDDEPEVEDPPMSFSRIDPEVLHSADATETYPDLAHVVKTTFELKEGEMLYLPASWFHEVRSGPASKSAVGPHVALNYWFHPPNALTEEDYETPYKTDFWATQFDALESLITTDSGLEKKNDSAKGWNKLVRDANGEFVMSEPAVKEEEVVKPFESYDEIPTHLRMAFKNPGCWFMRNKKTGLFMGKAKKATYPTEW